VIVKASEEYSRETEPPPCPSVKVNDRFLVKKGVITYDQLKAGLFDEG
jgi:hypothetical protein